jgi:HK97 family phage major capsid protein
MNYEAQMALSAHSAQHRDAMINEVDLRMAGTETASRHNARLTVARALAREEDSSRSGDSRFQLGRYLRSLAGGAPVDAFERVVIERAAGRLGQAFDRNRAWVPFGGFATRAMTASVGAKGGYLTGVEMLEPADVLRPWSVTASAGALIVTDLTSAVTIPTVKTEPTAQWVGEGVAATDSDPVFGQGSATPKTVVALVKMSRQLVQQGEAAEPLVRALIMRSVGAALDRAVLNGAGGAEPLGIFSASGIGTQAGASLEHADLLAMRRQVLAAGGQEDALRWIAPPLVQELLGARERSTNSGRYLWDDGKVLGLPAHATKNAPAASLVVGDFRQCVVTIFGPGIRLDVDPSQDFINGGIVLRAMLLVDVVAAQPSAFTVATSVS